MKSFRAIWNNEVIAEANDTVLVEGNHYFHRDSIKMDVLEKIEKTTHCPWKGEAEYYNINVGGETNPGCVWTYPEPSTEAMKLKDHFAFWNGVEVVSESLEERRESISVSVKNFYADILKLTANDHGGMFDSLTNFLEALGPDYLTYSLPNSYINDLSFFNFSNANNACFHTNKDSVIQRVNPTFEWSLNHLPSFIGRSIHDILSSMEIIEGLGVDEFLSKVNSHGWARIPKLKLEKDGKDLYYALDVAITKHGDIDDLTGYQGQLIDITREVELSLSVEQSEANMRSLLSGIHEGLFFFDEEGNVPKERSKALSIILPGSEDLDTLPSILGQYCSTAEANVKMCLKLLWEEDDGFMSDFDTTVSMLPRSIRIPDGEDYKDLIFAYLPLNNAQGDLEKVIAIVTDVTQKLKNEAEARLQAERVKKVGKAASNFEAFKNFCTETDGIFDRASGILMVDHGEPERIQLLRDLHTLKGSIGTYDFATIASKIHDLEDMFSDGRFEESPDQGRNIWKSICEQWLAEKRDIQQVLGIEANDSRIMVDRERLEEILNYASSNGDQKLKSMVEEMGRLPLDQALAKFKDYLYKLASREEFDKSIEVVFDEASVSVSTEEVQKIDGALIHIFRNSFDHGIETRSVRKDLGKPDTGRITVSCQRVDGCLHLSIEDDGGGIDGQRLAKKALESGFWDEGKANNASELDRVHLIFAAGLSSKEEVSDVSGRGVGMDAVAAIIQDLGGKIDVETALGKGTKFLIRFPGENKLFSKKAA